MANVIRPGFWPVGTLSGVPWLGSVRAYAVAAGAADIFVGDLVRVGTDGKANVITATTNHVAGACVGVLPVDPQALGTTTLALAGGTSPLLGQKYSSAAGTILVCTAPDAIYEADCEGTAEAANIGQTTSVTIVAGNTTTGLSKQVCNMTDSGVTNNAQLRVIDIPTRVDNTAGVANCHVLVVVNAHQFAHFPSVGI